MKEVRAFVVEFVAAALASTPPANVVPPGDTTMTRAELIAALAECYRLTGADPDGNEDWRLAQNAVDEVRRLRAEADAEANREVCQSDPPGLVALVDQLQTLHRQYPRGHQVKTKDAALAAVLVYPLPASPQAETMPTIQVGDVVRVADSVAVIGSANAASFWGRQVLDAIYRDPLWRRPTKGDE